ncbi:hypothetical protein BHE74_00017032 [Ensete ventricosum]|nr:hypothetical protein BHE74_00017032 [Ensete ventricosum]
MTRKTFLQIVALLDVVSVVTVEAVVASAITFLGFSHHRVGGFEETFLRDLEKDLGPGRVCDVDEAKRRRRVLVGTPRSIPTKNRGMQQQVLLSRTMQETRVADGRGSRHRRFRPRLFPCRLPPLRVAEPPSLATKPMWRPESSDVDYPSLVSRCSDHGFLVSHRGR